MMGWLALCFAAGGAGAVGTVDVVPFYASLGFTRYGAMIRRDRAAIMTLRDRFAGDAGHPTDHHDEEERP